MEILQRFAEETLSDAFFPGKEICLKEHWNVSGILKQRSNQEFKFDVRPMFTLSNKQIGKKGNTKSKADKMVFETDKEWVIIDIEELHKYLKKQKSNTIQFEDLIKKIDWNIFIKKVRCDTKDPVIKK